jgi:phage-related minor tail protein
VKFVTTAQTALTEGAAQVAAAAKQGSEVLSTGLADALAQGQKTVTQMGGEFAQITRELGALAGPLNPSEIAGDLAPALTQLQNDLQAIPAQLASAGSRLVDAGKNLGGLTGDLQAVAGGVAKLPARLVTLRPDLSGVMPGINGLLDRVQALSTQAQGVQPRLVKLASE